MSSVPSVITLRDEFKADLAKIFPEGRSRIERKIDNLALKTFSSFQVKASLQIKKWFFMRLRNLTSKQVPKISSPLLRLNDEWSKILEIDREMRKATRFRDLKKKSEALDKIISDLLIPEELFEEAAKIPVYDYDENLMSKVFHNIIDAYIATADFTLEGAVHIVEFKPHLVSSFPVFFNIFSAYFKKENFSLIEAFEIVQQQEDLDLKQEVFSALIKAYIALPNFDLEKAIQLAEDNPFYDFRSQLLCEIITTHLRRPGCDLEEILQITIEKVPESCDVNGHFVPDPSIRGEVLCEIFKAYLAKLQSCFSQIHETTIQSTASEELQRTLESMKREVDEEENASPSSKRRKI